MPTDIIQWFPGHMAKTKRLITENLSQVDAILELLDARIPRSSKNPDIEKLVAGKPIITVLNKASLADSSKTEKWKKIYSGENRYAVVADCIDGKGIDAVVNEIKTVLKDKISKYDSKGMSGRTLKVMVVGIPNVGKSSLINKLCKKKKAEVENRPGVTLNKQWVKTDLGIELMDMPGVLWPKFDDRTVGENLAITGAIKDTVLETEEIAVCLCARLKKLYPELLSRRYKLETDKIESLEPYEIFEEIGRKRGLLMRGGEINTDRCASMLLEEFRNNKIGRITLE